MFILTFAKRTTAPVLKMAFSLSKFAEVFFRNPRSVLALLAVVAFVIYAKLYLLTSKGGELEDGLCFNVFDHHMQAYYDEIDSHDASVNYFPYKGVYRHSELLPYVGNGLFGVALGRERRMALKHPGQHLFSPTNVNPVREVQLNNPYSSVLGVYVTRYTKGVVEEYRCFEFDKHCIRVHSVYYASRLLPNLFVQQISIENPTENTVAVTVRHENNFIPDSFVTAIQQKPVKVSVSHGQIDERKLSITIAVVGESSAILRVPAKSSHSQMFLTFIAVHNDSRVLSAEDLEKHPHFSQAVHALSITNKRLYEDHVATWQELWLSGFSIVYSHAPDSLNGDNINATMYYILSNYVYKKDDLSVLYEKSENNQLQCYSSHSTLLYPSKLWVPINTLSSLLSTTTQWHHTLAEHGCQSLISAGARGVMQALILSFGAFKHKLHHVQFEQQPNELHRNVQFSQNVFFNVWVEITSENKPVLYVNLNATNLKAPSLYACEAGCSESLLMLSKIKTKVLVRQTDPPTPILYIADEAAHFDRLKMSIHVKDVVEAPAHENHVIAMHKHGHRLGGLPTIFWLTFGFLLVVFHLFLVKLIYNEYKGSRKKIPTYRYSA